MEIKKNFDLKSFNTFGVHSICDEFADFNNEDQLIELLNDDVFILGGGSNILLPGHLKRRVLHNNIQGIRIVSGNADTALVAVGGGVIWHDFVLWAVQNELGGVENLSLIPGTVGAAPIQNIGAYGVELASVFESLKAIDLATGEMVHFSKDDCHFGYRNSIFKNEAKGKYCIVEVYMLLSKIGYHGENTSYASLSQILKMKGIKSPTISDVSNTVIEIRQSKLPDPNIYGNAGSFFKNVTIDAETYEELLSKFPDLIFYKLENDQYKIPTGWLIDKCGWKGRRVGNVGCYKKQALCLVNHGGGTSEELIALSKQIQKDVEEKFGLQIEPEVNFIG